MTNIISRSQQQVHLKQWCSKTHTHERAAVRRENSECFHCLLICLNPHHRLRSLWSRVSTVTRCQMQQHSPITMLPFSQPLLIAFSLRGIHKEKGSEEKTLTSPGFCFLSRNFKLEISSQTPTAFSMVSLSLSLSPRQLRSYLTGCQIIRFEGLVTNTFTQHNHHYQTSRPFPHIPKIWDIII